MPDKTTHTPGPWEAHNGEVTTRQENGRSYRRIAAVQDYGTGSLIEVDEANARLIAAAPELLFALEEAHRFVEVAHGNDCRCKCCLGSRAAIAKAKGEV